MYYTAEPAHRSQRTHSADKPAGQKVGPVQNLIYALFPSQPAQMLQQKLTVGLHADLKAHWHCHCNTLLQQSPKPLMQPRRAVAIAAQAEQETPAEREREVRQEVTRRIKQLGEQRRFKEAVQELASLAALGVQPDTQAATALLAACTRSRDMNMAQSVFAQLFDDFLQPDEITFAVMLRGFGNQTPADWQKVDSVLTQMRMTYGVEPTATSYNALLEICYRTNDSDRALDVLDRMADDKVQPDDITYDIVARKRVWRSYMRKVLG